jgi:hypothetical protein
MILCVQQGWPTWRYDEILNPGRSLSSTSIISLIEFPPMWIW